MDINKIKEMFLPTLPNDLTKQDIRHEVIKIAWPALTELLLVQLCAVVDNMMVGHLGALELASVGYCTQPKFLLLAVFIALNSGATALIARFKGGDNKEDANNALRQCVIMTFVLSIIISIIGFIFSKQMVMIMGASSYITIQNATIYMQIQMLGFVFNALTLSITAGLRGIGKTKISMYYNLTANAVNVILNYLLIYGKFGFPKLGVAGASIATVIGQGIAFIIAFIVIIKKDGYLYLELKKIFKFDFKMCKRILNIGVPAMFEQLALRFGLIIYTITVSSLGEMLYATHQIALNIMSLSFMNGQAFGISATSLIGQSLGYNRPDHGKAYTYECRKMGMFISIAMAVVFIAFSQEIMHMFTTEEFIIQEGKKILFIVAINQPIQASQLILSGALRGAGDTRTVAISTLIGILIIRPIMSIIAVKYLGLSLIGAWCAVIIDQIVRSLITYERFATGKWEKIRV